MVPTREVIHLGDRVWTEFSHPAAPPTRIVRGLRCIDVNGNEKGMQSRRHAAMLEGVGATVDRALTRLVALARLLSKELLQLRRKFVRARQRTGLGQRTAAVCDECVVLSFQSCDELGELT